MLHTNNKNKLLDAVLNVGVVTLQTLAPKKKAAKPHAPFAWVTTPQTTKDVQNI
jgi:hypothetical protein